MGHFAVMDYFGAILGHSGLTCFYDALDHLKWTTIEQWTPLLYGTMEHFGELDHSGTIVHFGATKDFGENVYF